MLFRSPVGWRRWAYEPLVWADADQTQRKDVGRNQFCTPEEFELYVSQAGFTPLANYHESQSVQIIAGKSLGTVALEAQTRRLDENRDQVAYSPLYAELFGQFVDVIFGTLSAQDMLSYMDQRADTAEVALYRPYLLSLWRKNAALWGNSPE